MTKRLVSLVVTVLMLVGTLPLTAVAADLEDIHAVLDGLNLSEITGGQDVEAVEQQFELPAEVNGVRLQWSSNDEEAVVTADTHALVLRNAGSRPVELTVTGTKGEDTADRTFQMTVAAAEYTGTPVYQQDFENVEVSNAPEEVYRRRNEQLVGIEDMTPDEMIGVVDEGDNHALQVKSVKGQKSYAFINFDAPVTGEVVVSCRLKPGSMGSAMNFWFLETGAADSTSGNQYVRTTLFPTKITVAGISPALKQDVWNTIALSAPVTEKPNAANKFDFYVNGAVAGKRLATQNNSGSHIKKIMLGFDKGNDEAAIDDIMVYAHPTKTVLDDVTVGVNDPDNVTGDVTLETQVGGAAVTWYSSDESAIAPDGTVTRPSDGEEEKAVELFAYIEKDGYRSVKRFSLKVLPLDLAADALDALDIQSIVGAGQTPQAVVEGFALPKSSQDLPLNWSSSDPSALNLQGNAARVFRSATDKNVILTAAVEINGVTTRRTFALTVKAAESSGEFTQSEIEAIVGQPLTAVKTPFTLPAFTSGNSEVIWTTSDKQRLFIGDGTAYPLGKNQSNAVTLTANIWQNGYYAMQNIELTVAEIENGRTLIIDEDFEETETGTLPSTLLSDGETKAWQKDATIAEGNKTVHYWVEEQGDIDWAQPSAGQTDPKNKALYVGNTVKNGGIHGDVHLLLDFPLEGKVGLQYSFLCNSGNYANMWLCSSKNNAVGSDILRLPTKKDTIQPQDGGTPAASAIAIQSNEWHTVMVEVDQSNKTYDLTVDGRPELTDRPLKNANFFQKMMFGYTQDAVGDFLFDNVSAWIDEVGSMEALAKSIVIENADMVTKDLNLLSETITGGAAIEWFSDSPQYLSASGKVTRPASDQEDANVLLSALISREGITVLREFEITVKREKTDLESVTEDLAVIDFDTDRLLMEDLSLPQTGHFGTNLLWTSSNESIIDPETGKVTLHDYNDMKIEDVTLTVKVVKNGIESGTKQFDFRVPENNLVLKGIVGGSSDQASARYAFVADNDPATSWKPAETDKKPYLTVELAGSNPTAITGTEVRGSAAGVRVSYSKDGSNYTELAGGLKAKFSPVSAKYVKFTFDSPSVSVSDLGIYSEATAQNLAEAEAALVDIGNTKNLKANLSLPPKSPNGYPLTWKSGNTNIISDSGIIYRQTNTKSTYLMMTVTVGGSVYTRRFNDVSVAGTGSGGSGGGTGGGGGRTDITAPALPPVTDKEEQPEAKLRFADVTKEHWAYQYIENFAAAGYVNGVSESMFEPERIVTREEFAKMLISALNLKAENASCEFTDVTADAWYYGPISQGCALNIIKGISDTEFGVGQPVTRQDMAVMIERAAAKTQWEAMEITAPDAPDIADYAVEAVSHLMAAGIMNGYEDGWIRPEGNATRAEAVTMLYRVLQKAM